MPTAPTFAVRETSVSRTANVGMVSKNGIITPITITPKITPEEAQAVVLDEGSHGGELGRADAGGIFDAFVPGKLPEI